MKAINTGNQFITLDDVREVTLDTYGANPKTNTINYIINIRYKDKDMIAIRPGQDENKALRIFTEIVKILSED